MFVLCVVFFGVMWGEFFFFFVGGGGGLVKVCIFHSQKMHVYLIVAVTLKQSHL